MPELTQVPSFAQPERRNLTLPITLAVLVLAIAGTVFYLSTAHKTADVTIPHVATYTAHTVFAKQKFHNGTDVAGQGPSSEDTLYIVPTVRIRNRMLIPLFLDSFHVTLNIAGGQIDTTPLQQQDIPTVLAAFPALKPLAATPLQRETTIPAGQTAEGTLLLQFAIPQSAWDQRTDATLTLTFYHQPPITLTIPKP